MRVSYGLPTPLGDHRDGLLSPGAVGDLARAAEEAGFAAVSVTEHPFPTEGWLGRGGHHALDPLVTLAFAAAATSTIALHTNLFIPAYRNPFLAAKGISTLDVLSGGRVILGIGTGYLEGEFRALGAPFAERNDRTDEAILAMKAAWGGEAVTMSGSSFEAEANVMLPRPLQQPHPPLWIGGNTRRAIRRAVELADGWSPFPSPARMAEQVRTAPLVTADDLAERLAYAREHAAAIGRTRPLDVAFIPAGLGLGTTGAVDPDAVVASCRELAVVGVTWVVVSLPGETVAQRLEGIGDFGAAVLPVLAEL